MRINQPGRYYVMMSSGNAYSHYDEDYELVTQHVVDEYLFNSLESEPNDTMAAAMTYPAGSSVIGQLSSATDRDYYAFDLSPGVFQVQVRSTKWGDDNNRLVLTNAAGVVMATRTVSREPSTFATLTARISTSGTYYLVMMTWDNGGYIAVEEELFWSLESEPNDTPAAAITYPVGSSLFGQVSSDSDQDYYALDLTPGVLELRLSFGQNRFGDYRLEFLDGNGVVLGTKDLTGYLIYGVHLTVNIPTKDRYYVLVSRITGYYNWDQDYGLFFEFDPDADRDGTTDSSDPDDDNDGMTDVDELAVGRNPFINEPAVLLLLDQMED